MNEVQQVNISDIDLNAGTQMRSWINTDVVHEYAALMKDGTVFDPVDLYRVPERSKLVMVNGFHRTNAAMEAGREQIDATITEGTLEEAIWAAIAANKKTALRRNSGDIQRAIEAALLHPTGAQMSDRAIADHVGCTHPTVGSVRAKLIATGKLSSGDERVGKDGRTTNTANIAAKHKVEQWKSLIFKPYMKFSGRKDADLVFIHQDGAYLFVATDMDHKRETILRSKYQLDYGWGHIRGANDTAYSCLIDKSYIDQFGHDGLTIWIDEFKDLPTDMQRITKSLFGEKAGYGGRIPSYAFKPIPADIQIGSLVARIQKDYSKTPIVAEVVEVGPGYVRVNRPSSNQRDELQVWFASWLVSVEAARQIYQSIITLGWGHATNDKTWQEQYRKLKRYYAPSELLIVRNHPADLAFGDDALRLNEVLNGVLYTDPDFGHIFITLDGKSIASLPERGMCGFVYETRFDELQTYWNSVIAASTKPTATPAAAPTQRQQTPLQQQQEEFERISDSINAGDNRKAELWHVWYKLKDIEYTIGLLDITEDDPLMNAAIPFQTLRHIIAGELEIELKDEEVEEAG